jgi:hypothetical protein
VKKVRSRKAPVLGRSERVISAKSFLSLSEGGSPQDTLQAVKSDILANGQVCWVKSQSALYVFSQTGSPKTYPLGVASSPSGIWTRVAPEVYQFGVGAPTADASYIGQGYLDTAAGAWYKSISVGSGAADWASGGGSIAPFVTGTGAPSANSSGIGELYFDSSNDVWYIAIDSGSGAADWQEFGNSYQSGAGAPAASADYIGQDYLDSSGGVWYKAISVGSGAADWAAAGGGSRVEPTAMVFTEVFKRAYFDGTSATSDRIFPTNLKWVDDPFTDATLGRFTQLTESTIGALAISGGEGAITNVSGVARSLFAAEGTAIEMPQVMTMVDLVSFTGSNGAYWANVVGVIRDSNNYIVANYNAVPGVVSVQVKTGGSSSFGTSVSVGLSPPFTLAMSIVGNWATVYTFAAGVWTKLTSYDFSGVLDFKQEDHSLWYGCFGLVTPGSQTNTTNFDNFKVGRFGGVGIRDISVYAREDGTPIVVGNTATVTATMAAPSGGIQESSMGVFDVDLEKKTFTQTGVLMFKRGASTQNDHAGQIILYPNGDQRVLVSTWGDFPSPPTIVYKFVPTGTDLSVGAHVIQSPTTLALTELPPGGGRYDPYMVKDGATWKIVYTATPVTANGFYPVMDSSSDLSTWANVGKDTTATRYEGSKLINFGGTYYAMWGGQYDMKLYDINMSYVGIANVISPGDGSTQPWPMIFPYNNLNILLTFDQQRWPTVGGVTFSWGWIRWFASP